MVGETPLIRGCRSLILNELVIKMTGKKFLRDWNIATIAFFINWTFLSISEIARI